MTLSVDVGKSPDIPYVYVNHEGRVQNYKPIQVVTACSLNIYNFPFDLQNCSLTFTSWLHTIQDINVSLWRTPEEVKEDKSVFMNKGEWELLYVLSQYRMFVENEDSYAELKFHVVIKRRPLFYAVNLLLPSMFLMVMDIIGFYLPPDSGERVSFKITLLLGYSVFLIIVSDTLPATAIGTPLIGNRGWTDICLRWFSESCIEQGLDTMTLEVPSNSNILRFYDNILYSILSTKYIKSIPLLDN
ncbi:unnamed protein product [Ranitomeya imitator]|uniref:5-hydroxytryptamine receptor 3A n=1 Tax=Ranitomeya imitator TaxID=111125 RepID=A0ABN9LI31_9NEOB|nr:unnamed protein product [Ranitomeya imitator]